MKSIFNDISSDPHAKYKPGYVAPKSDLNNKNNIEKDDTYLEKNINKEPKINTKANVSDNFETSQNKTQEEHKKEINTLNTDKAVIQSSISTIIKKNKKFIWIGASLLIIISTASFLLLSKELDLNSLSAKIFNKQNTTSQSQSELTSDTSTQYRKHQDPTQYLEKRKIFMQHFLNNDAKMKESFEELIQLEDVYSERLLGASVGDLLLLWPEQKSIDIAEQYIPGLAQRAAKKYRTSINMVEADFANCNNQACELEKAEVIREVNRFYLSSTRNLEQINQKIESIKLWRLEKNTD